MSDINWHSEMGECPNDVDILVKYDSGDVAFTEADDNDVEWAKHYPPGNSRKQTPGVSTPVQWAHVA